MIKPLPFSGVDHGDLDDPPVYFPMIVIIHSEPGHKSQQNNTKTITGKRFEPRY
jgi:hypothetical protein